jgi:hypothetical protein
VAADSLFDARLLAAFKYLVYRLHDEDALPWSDLKRIEKLLEGEDDDA